MLQPIEPVEIFHAVNPHDVIVYQDFTLLQRNMERGKTGEMSWVEGRC